jgi:hypothetical protein
MPLEQESAPIAPIQAEPIDKQDVKVAKFTCFPNPTAGDLQIIFNTSTATEATLLITNRFSHPIYQREVVLENGLNEWSVDGKNFPAGVLIVLLKTPEATFYKKVIKWSGG